MFAGITAVLDGRGVGPDPIGFDIPPPLSMFEGHAWADEQHGRMVPIRWLRVVFSGAVIGEGGMVAETVARRLFAEGDACPLF